jgi:CheY-like chemotaxis protein
MSKDHADVYTLTAKGTQELKGGATALGPRELEVMVLVDGHRPVSGIAAHANASDTERVRAILEELLGRGYIRLARDSDDAEAGFDYILPSTPRTPAELSAGAAAHVAEEAAAGASALKQNGYYVSIARRGRTHARASTAGLTVVILEDEPLVAKYLKALVEMEGHTARVAANRAEIVEALRAAPLPDLAILDVMLPDANGFEVLESMKAHPRLSEVPVMMVTTQATRESVMTGLALGADGYFTKPFEVDTLLRGMKAVLGLLPPGDTPPTGAPPYTFVKRG